MRDPMTAPAKGENGLVEDLSWHQFPERTLYSLAKWKNGLAFKNIDFTRDGDPVIKIAELKDGITETTGFTNKKYDPEVRVKPGDLLFSWSGNPKTSIDAFYWNGPPGWLVLGARLRRLGTVVADRLAATPT